MTSQRDVVNETMVSDVP